MVSRIVQKNPGIHLPFLNLKKKKIREEKCPLKRIRMPKSSIGIKKGQKIDQKKIKKKKKRKLKIKKNHPIKKKSIFLIKERKGWRCKSRWIGLK